jgi:hypothetical protein
LAALSSYPDASKAAPALTGAGQLGAAVTLDTPTVGGAPAADSALRAAHQRLLADSSIQFDLPVVQLHPPTPPPGWLQAIINFLGPILAPILQVIFFGGLGLLAVGLLYVIARSFVGAEWTWGRRKPSVLTPEPEWRPDAAQARVLLEDADKLAAEGRFAEAAHLLLHRSLEDVRGYRPRAIRPAVTSRELAVSEALPGAARSAFSHIAEVVEHSYFGGRGVDAAAYAECRRSYEAFAFPQVWAA